MNKIDINKPLEAVHTATGKVVPMIFDRMSPFTSDRFYTKTAPDGAWSNDAWDLDGQDACHYKTWTIRNVAPKVDFSKPLETADGRTVELLPEKTYCGDYWRVYIGGLLSVRHYSEDGKHRYGSHPDIRNVTEVAAPKIDWTKPIEDSEGRRCYVNAGSRYHCPPSTYVVDFDPHSDSGNFFDASGYREGEGSGHSPSGQLRNVAEVPTPAAPALDLTKPLQTRDGRSVVLITSEGRGKYPVLGYVGDDTGPTSWTSEGKYQAHTAQRDEDLVNVEDKPDVFFGSIYRCGSVNTWTDDNVAYFPSEEGRATVKVTFPKDGKPTVELL